MNCRRESPRASSRPDLISTSATGPPVGDHLDAVDHDLTAPGGGGKVSDFDHKVDHVMTNAPKKVKLVNSTVTGRQPVSGFWDSDHAGTFSTLALL